MTGRDGRIQFVSPARDTRVTACQGYSSNSTLPYKHIQLTRLVKRIGWVATRATDNVAQDLDITRSRHTSNDQKYIPISLCINLSDFEQIARTKLSKRAWIYYSSTSEDSYTHSQNINDWKKVSFRPRVMRDVDSVTTTRLILGQHSAEPFFIAPAALARLGHPDGESCLARGATQYNIPYAMSTASSVPMEDLAAYFQADTGRGSIWFQLYVQREEADTRVLIRRARSLGFRALLITVDTAAVAPREEDDRYKLELALEQGNEPPTFFSQVPQENGRKPAYRAPYSSTLNWKDLVWIKEEWGGAGPIGLKGIATVEDTLLASQHGIDCVYLSNHGGRQLDGAPSSMRTLLEIRKKCPEILGHCQILMDGGVRRGSDIIKALCLGATAVGLGRPFMFALSAYGTDGVARAIQSKLPYLASPLSGKN